MDGQRTPWAVTIALFGRLGFAPAHPYFWRDGRWRYPTLAQFIRTHPKGRFILHRRGQAFALIDGVVHDRAVGTGPRSRIRRA